MLSLMEGQRPDHKNEKHQFTVPAVLHIAQSRSFRSFPSESDGNRVGVAAHERMLEIARHVHEIVYAFTHIAYEHYLPHKMLE